MDIRAQLQDHLKRDRDEFIRLCQEMVRIPSENPPGDTTRLYGWLTSFMESRGLDYETVAPVPEWPNLVASFEGGESGRHLILNGHLDVFPAGDPALWSADPHSGLLKDGKIFGRGVSDMKAGTLATILTYAYLAEVKQHLKGKLTLTSVSDEETGGKWGAEYLVENQPELLGDCVLNGEPGTPRTVRYGEKGPIFFELLVQTKGGHGGNTQVSRNAIEISSDIISELKRLRDFPAEAPPGIAAHIDAASAVFDEMLGTGATETLKSVTLNIGVIGGGLKVNVIAPSCRTEIDIRCPMGITNQQMLDEVEHILSRHPEASYQLISHSDPNYSDPEHEMVQIIQRNGLATTGIKPLPLVSLGGSDCRHWRLRGVPAYIYGPTPYNMARPDEHITVDDLLGTVHVHVLSAFDYLMNS